MTTPPPPSSPPPPSPPPASPGRRQSVGAGYAVVLVCWAASIVPLVVAFLTLLCDVDGECTPADTTTRRIGLTIAVLLWLASGPAAKAVSGKKWFMLASVIPFLLALPLLPYFIAGP